MVLEVCYPPGYPAKAKLHLKKKAISDVQMWFGPITGSTSKVCNFKQIFKTKQGSRLMMPIQTKISEHTRYFIY